VTRRWQTRQRSARTPPQRPRSTRGERGSALVELTWLGLVLLIPLVYVLITLVSVQRAAFGVTEAARSAGRAFVLAPDVAAARQRAYDAAQVAMADQGVTLAPRDLVVVCRPTPASCLQPGSSVEVDITLQVRLPAVPDFFGRTAASVVVRARHVEPYGVYREAVG
jgi:hypothetical protein